MKKNLSYYLLIIASLVLSVTACKKDNKEDDKTNDTEISTHSDDQSEFAADVDAVVTESNTQLESTPSFTGKGEDMLGAADIANADVAVDVNSNPMKITITYHGDNQAGDRTRTGKIILSMAQGAKWKTAGTAVTITYQDLKITRKRDNKSITINGVQTYTNVNGGTAINLLVPGTSLKHTLTSDGMTVTFDNNNQRSWKVAKQYVATLANNVVTISASGTHTEGSITNVAEWGTNRFGRAFTTSTIEPLILKSDCLFRIGSGKVQHTTPATTAVATFGLNADGNPTGCPGANAYYCKLVWTGPNNNSLSVIFPY